jgi:hypothetical protein
MSDEKESALTDPRSGRSYDATVEGFKTWAATEYQALPAVYATAGFVVMEILLVIVWAVLTRSFGVSFSMSNVTIIIGIGAVWAYGGWNVGKRKQPEYQESTSETDEEKYHGVVTDVE